MYKFQYIVDSRLKHKTKSELEKWNNTLAKDIKELDGVELYKLSTERIEFSGSEPCIQWRTTYKVKKTGRKTTWNEVFRVINRNQAPYYQKMPTITISI